MCLWGQQLQLITPNYCVSVFKWFETAVAQEAGKRGFQGVVCGHIHHAEIRTIDGLIYCNDGDWVESLSALAEDHNGTLSLIRWENRLLPNATENKQISMGEALASVKSA